MKENLTNKSTNTSLGTSDVLYPTQNAVKAYVDSHSSSVTNRGDWTSGTNYNIGDIVFYWPNSSYYFCKEANNDTFTPEQTSKWLRFGLNKVTTDSNFRGQGTYSNPLTLGYYKRSNTLYASGTNNPQRMQNYFVGMDLPNGVTESFHRISTGTYVLRYTGDVSIPEIDVTNTTSYREVSFSNNPNIRLSSISGTISGSTRTLEIEFTNTVSGTLTDGFTNLLYSITFYKAQ